MITTSTKGNPYTHEEHTRTCYSGHDLPQNSKCAWCGQTKNRLYAYSNQKQKQMQKTAFCNKECANAYNS